jgi:hypothetical protein
MAKTDETGTVKPRPRGSFYKGQPGGPGRPKEDEATKDLLSKIEAVVRSGMSKGELADRLKAAGIAIKLKGLKEKRPEEVTTPWVLKLSGLLTDLAARCSEEGIPVNGVSVVDRMATVCPTCPLLCKAKDPPENFEG